MKESIGISPISLGWQNFFIQHSTLNFNPPSKPTAISLTLQLFLTGSKQEKDLKVAQLLKIHSMASEKISV